MVKNKIRERLASESSSKSNNFFYRLVSNQRFLAIIGLLFLVLIIFPLAKTYSQRRLVEKEIDDVKKQISDFENKNKELTDMVAYLGSDQSLEQQARLNLNLKKPGEQVVVIEDKKDENNSAAVSSSTESVSNFQKWRSYFFD